MKERDVWMHGFSTLPGCRRAMLCAVGGLLLGCGTDEPIVESPAAPPSSLPPCGPDQGPGDCRYQPGMAQVFQTSKDGDALADLGTQPFAAVPTDEAAPIPVVVLDPTAVRQSIVGFGSSFTEASAWVLQQVPPQTRAEIIERLFGSTGAWYTLTRTTIASSDLGLDSYSYAAQPDLSDFSVAEDEPDLIPLILDAMQATDASFRIVASPWSAPPFMKDNGVYYDPAALYGGQLLPEHYATFAEYIARYLVAYRDRGIDVWAITPENEPEGNSGQWESLEFTPEQMASFVGDHLGPALAASSPDVKLLVYDHNRNHVQTWVDAMLDDDAASPYVDGVAVHPYASTYLVFEDVLDWIHDRLHSDQLLINTEAALLSEEEAFDNWQWWWEISAGGPESWHDVPEHYPEYVPVYWYVRDLVVGLNHWFNGWIDWNLALDRHGLPRHPPDGLTAPVLIDTDTGEVFYTPLYYVMAHFSRYLRPDARVLDTSAPTGLLATSVWNPDGTIAVVVANITPGHPTGYDQVIDRNYRLQIGAQSVDLTIPAHTLQTVVVTPDRTRSP